MGLAINSQISTYDLVSYEKDIDEEDIVLVFGGHAKRICKGSTCKAIIDLPELVDLDPTEGIETVRQEAYTKLLKLKEALQDEVPTTVEKNNQNLTEGSLPKITSGEVLILEKMLLDKGISHWVGITIEGKSVRMTREPEESIADINITFAELFALKTAMEVLRIKEFEVVHNTTNNNK